MSRFETPEKGQRRRSRSAAYVQQGLTPVPSYSNAKQEPKLVYLIRHGESMGQKAPSRKARQTDPSLQDCGLSDTGIQQALGLAQQLQQSDKAPDIELVLSSPLTRALQTALTAFPNQTILCHYHLREIGSPIPENCPRPMASVLQELQRLNHDTARIDYQQLQPPDWPRTDSPKVVRSRHHVPNVFQWLAFNRPERVIAVVCHYHVIRAALQPSHDDGGGKLLALHPQNCEPIACRLCPTTGRLTVIGQQEGAGEGDIMDRGQDNSRKK